MEERGRAILPVFKTVETFGRIVGRKLVLRNGNYARTNSDEIVVPFRDVDAYVLAERQLAHVLFRSDAKARGQFVREFIHKTVRGAFKHDLPARDFAEAQGVIERIVDVLESRRIESLWGLIYPGSLQHMQARHKNETSHLILNAHDTFFNLFVCLDARHDIGLGAFDRYRPFFEEALAKVERRSFDASLTLARWLVSKLVTELIKEKREENAKHPGAAGTTPLDQPITAKDRLEALRDMTIQFDALPDNIAKHYGDYLPSTDKDLDAESRAAANTALTIDLRNGTDVDEMLSASASQMRDLLTRVEDRLAEQVSREEWLKGGTDCEVDFIDVPASAAPTRIYPPQPDDAQTIARMRALFQRVLTRRTVELDESGSEVDISAYIERRISGTPSPCFRVPRAGRGFRLLVLLDRSTSMEGARTRQAERAARLVLDALDFPFVEVSVWGFQGPEDGKVLITRFDPDVASFDTELSKVGGDTPLHVAVRLAVRELSDGSEVKHLVIVTDGAPYFAGKNGKETPEGQLHQEVHEQVQHARRCGINVTSLLIGDRLKSGKLVFDVKRAELQHMFGSEQNWKCVDEERLGTDLVQAVTTSFVRYLNRN